MKKKTSSKLKITKIRITDMSKPIHGDNARTLPTTQFISCGPTHWVC
ncbi:hypothetical protein [Chitinophaga solisilvae]|uniref:Uncharacterized protein n=1 Tax=Chitinophaga solisilvae TaxID=1233460 RepID=A0A9Q5GPF9_9BACT|nr:hypothetical protein [Chitinophaga solisilvae]NSL90935.1 hypothetical protein [Chitinophaga solisilvae]